MRDGEAIATALGGERYAKGWTFRCPVHDDHKPSASIRDDGLITRWVCGPERRRELWAALDKLGFTDDDRAARRVDPKTLEERLRASEKKAQALWTDIGGCSFQDVEHTECVSYLQRRGITLPRPECIRDRAGHGFSAAVTTPEGVLTCVHEKGGRTVKNTGHLSTGGAVQLSEPEDGVLGLAEGVEDALTATQLFGVSCWATLGAGRLHAIKIPLEVNCVHLYADNDDAGRAAVVEAVAAYTGSGLRVREAWPPEQYKDWNDALRAGWRP